MSSAFRLAAVLACLALPATALCAAAAEPVVSERLRDLLGRMTIEEKVGQLDMPARGGRYSDEAVEAGRTGAVLNFFAPEDIRRVLAANDRSRLKIPLLFGLDVIHGYRTQFPMPLAEAASFDPSVAERAAYWAGVESKAAGVNLTFTPVADLARDPRWGRIVEGGGEDPLLSGLFAKARVEGFRRAGVATTLKHFAGYGAVEGGRDYAPADVSLATLRDRYLPPYRAAVEAGVDLVMTSYVSLNGVPTTASRWLMTEVLRHEWGFEGYVVSDMNAIPEVVLHGYAETDREATQRSFEAGVDQDMDGGLYAAHLADLVRTGAVPEHDLDRAVLRVLAVKERLGLFDAPPPDPDAARSVLGASEVRDAARELARETFVLLKNDGGVLPVGPATRRIAVIGAMADDRVEPMGNNVAAGTPDDTVTILDGIRQRAGVEAVEVDFAPGCDADCADDSGFDAAVRTAARADLVVVVAGEPRDYSGEGSSRADLALPGRQRDLIRRLAATGRPVAVVLLGGRPLALGDIVAAAPAWLMTWYPGTMAGHAVADILFGDEEPGGRLPVTFPRATGQVPMTYDGLPTPRPGRDDVRYTTRYLDTAHGPLFPFGWGLGYGDVHYGEVRILTPRPAATDRLRVTVRLTNRADRSTRETVQLYVRDPVASRVRPFRELKAFGKVALGPGESRDVLLDVPVEKLGFHLEDGTWIVEAGRFQIFVGRDASAPLAGEIVVPETLTRSPTGRAADRFETGHLTALPTDQSQK